MKTRFLVMVLTCVGLCSVGLAAVRHSDARGGFRLGVFEPPRVAPDFALEGSDGSQLTLGRYTGKVVVLEFGFTHCAKVCPITLGTLTHVFGKLGDAAREVQLVFITVDPQRDDASRLHEFLGHFDSRFIGGTGSPAQLDSVQRSYGAVVSREPSLEETNYQVHHSSSLYLIDRRGRLRVLIPFGTSADDIVHDINAVLRE